MPGLRRLLKMLLMALLAVLLPACSFAYLPLVPPAQEWEPVLELRGSGGLALDGGRLVLNLTLARVPEPGWLAVQWFGPGRRLASDAIWITPEAAGRSRLLYLPEEVEVTPGLWRAVVSYQSVVARQFTLEVP